MVGAWGTRHLLRRQAAVARRVIGRPLDEDALTADRTWCKKRGDRVELLLLGDSIAAGLGADRPRHTLGAQLARKVGKRIDRSVRLHTAAVVGSESSVLRAQPSGLPVGYRPDVAVIVVGGNDITHRTKHGESVAHLAEAITALRERGCEVVVGTCPDLGALAAIPQPLRALAGRSSRQLAAAQREAALALGARVVSLSEVVGPFFMSQPDAMFSEDRFHPSGEGDRPDRQHLSVVHPEVGNGPSGAPRFRRVLTPRGRFGLTTSVLLAATVLAGPAVAVDDPPSTSADDALLSLDVLGSHGTGQFDESAAEIVVFDPGTDRTFVVNANSGRVDVLDASDPTDPVLEESISAAGTTAADGSTIPAGAVANSVDVREDGLVVVAVESDVKTDPGWLLVLDGAGLDTLGAVRVGALPDMVTITPDGRRAVVANEGEPSDSYTIDPEGSVAIVELPVELATPDQTAVATADFHDYEDGGSTPLPAGVRVFGPTVNERFPVSANLEPEYVALDDAGTTAYVSLQENNALAVIDLTTATVTDLLPLRAKDHSIEGQGLDPSDRDPRDAPTTAIGTWPVKGLYMPDTIHSYTSGGRTYLVTANEGDAREWGDYVEGARVKDLGDDGLAPICADHPAAELTSDAQLGRLNVTTASGLSADGSCYEQLYSFGARSFSIVDTDGTQVFDSGDAFEQITAEAAPEFFNSNHTASDREGRSDDKGPEPEAITVGAVGDRTYAFIGFERVGGIAVFDITTPADSTFVTYLNNRDFSVSVEDADDPAAVLDGAGDLGPESIAFVAAEDSPTSAAMLAVGNEVSGTTTFFSITADFAQTNVPQISGKSVVGTQLTATVEPWSPEAEFTYAWQRDGERIDDADESTYTPADADAGTSLTVAVTGTAASHRAVTLTSQSVEVPSEDAAPPTPTPTPVAGGDQQAAGGVGADDTAGSMLPAAGSSITWLAVLAALAAITAGTVLVRRRS